MNFFSNDSKPVHVYPGMLLLVVISLLISCTTQKLRRSSGIPNPFVPGFFADPTIVSESNRYFLYATIDPWGGDSLAFWESSDFINWERKPLNWPTVAQCISPTANTSKVWAPSVVKGTDGRYHMFVSVGSEVYAGVADRPEGPWRNVKADGGPFIKTQKPINVHTIDAEAFVDTDGRSYLYWGSGWDWKDGHCFAGELNAAMDSFMTTPVDITPPNYFEAPYMLKSDGIYYLMYSQGKCTDSTYKVRYSTGPSPFGPWTEGANSPVLTTDTKKKIIGPGHHSVLNQDGRYYILYHRIANPNNADLLRELCIDPLNFDNAGNILKVNASGTGGMKF